jgi:hypothetical protein
MHRSVRAQFMWGVVGCVLVVVSGCAIGPTALRGNRPEYNRVIQQTEKEELLLNIVRLRYGEHIKFLQVTSIVSSLNISASANASATVPFGTPERLLVTGANTANVGGGLNYSETPTITYVPVEGQQFANQILSGASVNNLQALLQSGWDIDRVMALLVDRMGPLVNNPAAATYPQFLQVIKVWRQVQARGDLYFVWFPQTDTVLAEKLPASAMNLRVFTTTNAPNYLRYNPRPDGNYQLVQAFDSVVMEVHYANQEEAEQVSTLLGSVSTRPRGELVERIALVSAVIPPNDYSKGEPVTQILLNLRSFADMLFSITPGVVVPPEDAAVVVPTDPAATKLINVRLSGSHPGKPFVAVRHRGHWFAIADTDIESKVNFGLLLTIQSLQTTSAGAVPGLTIPVGGH